MIINMSIMAARVYVEVECRNGAETVLTVFKRILFKYCVLKGKMQQKTIDKSGIYLLTNYRRTDISFKLMEYGE